MKTTTNKNPAPTFADRDRRRNSYSSNYDYNHASVIKTCLVTYIVATLATSLGYCQIHSQQIQIPVVEHMSNCPDSFLVPDWNRMARQYADLVFDLKAKGEYLPLSWIDKSHINYPEDAFGIYATVGDPRCGPSVANGTYHLASCSIGAVIGSSLAGLDMTRYKERNWVRMCGAYFNKANGRNVFMEHTHQFYGKDIGGCYGFDFWGDVLPSNLAIQLATLYPKEKSLREPIKATADQFVKMTKILLATPQKFGWSTFDWLKMEPVKNIVPAEADVAAPAAQFLYLASEMFKDPSYLKAATETLDYLNGLQTNPIYSGVLPFGVYTMARMNAEQGTSYDVSKVLGWSLDGGKTCVSGVHAGKWGGYDMSGLVEMYGCERLYAFETFLYTESLIPVTRYDASTARAIGKLMENVASNARYFYPDYLPPDHQRGYQYRELTKGVIGSEALTTRSFYSDPPLTYGAKPIPYAEVDKWENLKTPDGKPAEWPEVSRYSLYGSSYIGVLGGIVRPSLSDPKILLSDCLKTDYGHRTAYPTYLTYNPYSEAKTVAFRVGDKLVDLYDAASHRIIASNVKNIGEFNLAGDTAAVIVLVPAGAKKTIVGNKKLANGVVIDWNCGK